MLLRPKIIRFFKTSVHFYLKLKDIITQISGRFMTKTVKRKTVNLEHIFFFVVAFSEICYAKTALHNVS